MRVCFPGYRFIVTGRRSAIWETVDVLPPDPDDPSAAGREPIWLCRSDDGQIGRFGLSELALWPQVISPRGETGWRSI
jgi:hypothetical protein